MAVTTAVCDQLLQRLYPGSRLIGHQPLTGGVSAQIERLDVVHADGSTGKLVLRHFDAGVWKSLSNDVISQEYRLLCALYVRGLPVPEPLYLDISSQLVPAPLLVMRYVEGVTEIAEPDLPHAVTEMAKLLAQLHSLDPKALALPPLPQRENPIEQLPQYLPAGEEWDVVRQALPRYRIAEAEPSLLHGDYWPGNLLWADGRIVALIDWEDAALGPPVSDLACARSELNALYGMDAAESFTHEYLARRTSELTDLAVWDLYVSCAALSSMHRWGLPLAVEQARRARTEHFAERAMARIL
jgi:aminoglycoside phosphotransferase (APT) family kinase protein